MCDTKTIKELCTYTIESQTKKQKSRAKNFPNHVLSETGTGKVQASLITEACQKKLIEPATSGVHLILILKSETFPEKWPQRQVIASFITLHG